VVLQDEHSHPIIYGYESKSGAKNYGLTKNAIIRTLRFCSELLVRLLRTPFHRYFILILLRPILDLRFNQYFTLSGGAGSRGFTLVFSHFFLFPSVPHIKKATPLDNQLTLIWAMAGLPQQRRFGGDAGAWMACG